MTKLVAPLADTTLERRWSIATGLSLLLMAIAGGLAYGYAHPLLHIANDVEATTTAIESRPILLFVAVSLWSLVAILDLLVSYGIYAIYRRSAPKLSFLVAAIRVAYTLILVIAITELGTLWIDDDAKSGLRQFESFEEIWSGGLVVFGVHLLMLSRLVGLAEHPYRSVVVLLALGGLGYMVTNGTAFVGYDEQELPIIVEAGFGVPMILGELLFAIRLFLSRRTSAPVFAGAV